jgi:hypothetical protein
MQLALNWSNNIFSGMDNEPLFVPPLPRGRFCCGDIKTNCMVGGPGFISLLLAFVVVLAVDAAAAARATAAGRIGPRTHCSNLHKYFMDASAVMAG